MITEEVYMICTMDKNFMLVPVLPLASCLPWGELLSESLIHISQMAGLSEPWVPRSNHLWFSIILDSLDDEFFFIFTNLNVLKCCIVGHELITKIASVQKILHYEATQAKFSIINQHSFQNPHWLSHFIRSVVFLGGKKILNDGVPLLDSFQESDEEDLLDKLLFHIGDKKEKTDVTSI